MSPDVYYVIDFVNPHADGQVHFFVMGLEASASLKKSLGHYLMGHPHIQIDRDKKFPVFPTRPEAVDHATKLGSEAQAANPARVPAEQQFPEGEVNRILEVGKPGAL